MKAAALVRLALGLLVVLSLSVAGCDCNGNTEGVCGDGVVDSDRGEECDDGNVLDGDGCDSMCLIEGAGVCGDGVVDPGEECDDGNTTDGDGCDSACLIEGAGVCGDGVVDPGEECDDGNTTAAMAATTCVCWRAWASVVTAWSIRARAATTGTPRRGRLRRYVPAGRRLRRRCHRSGGAV